MASFVLKDVSVTYNGVDISSYVTSIDTPQSAAEIDDTAMGDDWMSFLAGLKSWSVSLTLNQDFAGSAVDDTLSSVFESASQSGTLVIKPTSGAVSSTNPSYTGTALLLEYSPISGSVGDLARTSPRLRGTGALTRATS